MVDPIRSGEMSILTTVDGPIGTITLNRPVLELAEPAAFAVEAR